MGSSHQPSSLAIGAIGKRVIGAMPRSGRYKSCRMTKAPTGVAPSPSRLAARTPPLPTAQRRRCAPQCAQPAGSTSRSIALSIADRHRRRATAASNIVKLTISTIVNYTFHIINYYFALILSQGKHTFTIEEKDRKGLSFRKDVRSLRSAYLRWSPPGRCPPRRSGLLLRWPFSVERGGCGIDPSPPGGHPRTARQLGYGELT